MKRRGRNLILGVLAVLLSGGLLFLLTLWTEPEGEGDASPSPTPEESFTLLQVESDAVAGVLIKPREGDSYEITRVDGVYTVKGAESLFPDNITTLSNLFASALRLDSLKRVAEKADSAALASFGLDAPSVTWRVSMKDGSSHDFALGKTTVTGGGYYVRRAGSSEVYVLASSDGKNLLSARSELYKLGFIPAKLQNSTADNVTWNLFETARLEQSHRVMDFDKLDEEELTAPGSNYFSSYRMNEPHDASINEISFSTDFMIPVTTINPGTLVEAHPADLHPYGLDEPVRLTLSDAEGWSGTLLIGGTEPESGGRYLMQEGIDAVLLDTKGDYSFLTVEEYKLRMSSLWLFNINEVERVDFYLNGTERELIIGYDPETMNCDGFLDGEPLSSDNTKRLYRTVLSINCSENFFGELPDKDATYRFTIHFLSGKSSTVELLAVNERQYVALLDGKSTDFLVYDSLIQQNVLDYFAMLDSGQDIR